MGKKVFVGLIVFALLSVLISACRVIDSASIPQNTKVQMGSNNFIQPSVNLKKGQSLDLIDTVASQHIITNGKWNGSTQDKTKEPGAPTANFTVNSAGEGQTVGPFTTAGSFNIFCTIHPGMNLTVVVK